MPIPEIQPALSSDDATINNESDTREVELEKSSQEYTKPVPVGLDAEDEYPDGGLRAWLVVAGTTAATFSTFGFVNSWGVFQAYYEQTILKDTSPSSIAWIGSIQYSLVFLPGLINGRLFDLGYFKIPLFIASVLLVVATFLIAECKEYWQFLLCQGFAVGLACGTIFGPASGIISHWFKRNRGLALGFMAIGSSIGGTVFPIAARRLIGEVGFPWTMRILAFILIATLGFSNLTLQRRLPPKNVKGGLFNLSAFKSPAYSIYCMAGLIAFLGLYTVLTYIDISATSVGIDPNFSFYLISIANSASGVARLMAGKLTDRWGAINIFAPLTAIAGVMTFAWPFARTKASLIVIAIIYGFSSGAYVGTMLVPVLEMGEIGDVGRRTGMAFTCAAIGALAGPPISGAINHATGGYEAVGYYAGSTIMLAVVLMLITRHLVLRRIWGKF